MVKDLVQGKEITITGRLSKTMNKLGRSLIVDLPSRGYRTVDHRTIKWIVVKNVKYVVKWLIMIKKSLKLIIIFIQ